MRMTLGYQLTVFDRHELAVDVDLLQLVDQNHRRIAVGRNVARGYGDSERPIRPIAESLHDAASLCAVLSDIGIVPPQSRQQIRRRAPRGFGSSHSYVKRVRRGA